MEQVGLSACVVAVVGISSLVVAKEASAKVSVPYQESIKRKDMTSTAQTASGYKMEGTKKQGISAKKRSQILANVRAAAEQESG